MSDYRGGVTARGGGRGRGRGRGRGNPGLNNQNMPPTSQFSAMNIQGDPTPRTSRQSEPTRQPRGERGERPAYKRNEETIVCTRPDGLASKKGTSGTPIALEANYFKLQRSPKFDFLLYRVDFLPDIESTFLKKKILAPHMKEFPVWVFDGTQLFLTTLINPDPRVLTVRKDDGGIVTITIRKVGVISMTDNRALQIFNLIVRKANEALGLKLIGRNYFDPTKMSPVPSYQLQVWPGNVSTIRQHENDLLFGIDVAHKIMRQETIYAILQRHVKQSRGNFKDDFMKEVIGTTVLTDYNNRTYKVCDVDWDKTPEWEFETNSTATGRISLKNYYQKTYGVTIRDLKQPILVSKPKKRDIRGGRDQNILLVPELCRATGLTQQMKNDFRLMQAVAVFTRLDPNARVPRYFSFVNRLRNTPESRKILDAGEMELGQSLVQIKGRVLPTQEIITFGGKVHKVNDRCDWSDLFRSNKMHTTIDIKRWCIIYVKQDQQKVLDFLQTMRTATRGMQYQMAEPRQLQIATSQIASYNDALNQAANMDPQFIMIVSATNRTDTYSAIKKVGSVDFAVPTQVVTMRVVNFEQRKLLTVATKIACQINCKLGGVPWTVSVPLSGLMTVGFDVYHDSLDRKKSFGALVATMDLQKCNRYFSCATAHLNGEELSNNLTVNLGKALVAYRTNHQTLPARIIFYRDGVGDGQLEYVVKHEIAQIKKLFEVVYPKDQHPKLLFIVVSKRINTRIFSVANRQHQNPPPGTVVDDVITLPERYDFFLVSHSERQGTVSPTSYNVILDTLSMPPDRVHLLTYRFTYLYYNWNGTISVPFVCQYAHKLAFLVGQYLHTPTHEGLNGRLHFL